MLVRLPIYSSSSSPFSLAPAPPRPASPRLSFPSSPFPAGAELAPAQPWPAILDSSPVLTLSAAFCLEQRAPVCFSVVWCGVECRIPASSSSTSSSPSPIFSASICFASSEVLYAPRLVSRRQVRATTAQLGGTTTPVCLPVQVECSSTCLPLLLLTPFSIGCCGDDGDCRGRRGESGTPSAPPLLGFYFRKGEFTTRKKFRLASHGGNAASKHHQPQFAAPRVTTGAGSDELSNGVLA